MQIHAKGIPFPQGSSKGVLWIFGVGQVRGLGISYRQPYPSLKTQHSTLNTSLLKPQCFYGVKAGGFSGGQVAGEQPCYHTNHQAQGNP